MSPDRQRVAIVTGGASGIGRATAEVLAADGDHVVLLDIAADAAAEVARSLPGDALALGTDVANPVEVTAAVAAVLDAFGRVDVLITSAGVAAPAPFLEIDDQAWHRMVNVHLTGAFHCCQAVVPVMRAQRYGRVLFVSSSGVLSGSSGGLAHYVSAKAGLVGLSRALARELGSDGITVNCVAPGPIETPILGHASADRMDQYVRETPVGRMGRPTDVAYAIRYLVSDEAEYVTGVVLAVNGGRNMH